jgi:hypothetical protein
MFQRQPQIWDFKRLILVFHRLILHNNLKNYEQICHTYFHLFLYFQPNQIGTEKWIVEKYNEYESPVNNTRELPSMIALYITCDTHQ